MTRTDDVQDKEGAAAPIKQEGTGSTHIKREHEDGAPEGGSQKRSRVDTIVLGDCKAS